MSFADYAGGEWVAFGLTCLLAVLAILIAILAIVERELMGIFLVAVLALFGLLPYAIAEDGAETRQETRAAVADLREQGFGVVSVNVDEEEAVLLSGGCVFERKLVHTTTGYVVTLDERTLKPSDLVCTR